MYLVLSALGLLALGALASLRLGTGKKVLVLLVSGIPAALLLAAASLLVLLGGPTPTLTLEVGALLGEVSLALDPLSALFVLALALVYPLALLFCGEYLGHQDLTGRPVTSHFLALPLFAVAMVLVFLVRSVLGFLLVWEAMSLLSLLLLAFDHRSEEVRAAAINYFIYAHVGVMLMLLGFALAWNRTGSADFAAFTPEALGDTATPVFLLLLAGFGLKAGLVPFHSWLPKAHPAAPAHISGLMSGLMIKTGVYGIARTILFTGADNRSHALILAALALITAVYAVINAASARNLKALLAWSSIENAGVMLLGLAAGMLGLAAGSPVAAFLGFGGALAHLLAHAVFKSALFFGAGTIHGLFHTYNLDKLGGLARRSPFFAGLFLLFAGAIAGLPLLAGFPGKMAIFLGLVKAAMPAHVLFSPVALGAAMLLAFCSTAAAMAYLRAFEAIFQGPEVTPPNLAKLPGPRARTAFVLAAVLLVAAGLVPFLLLTVVAAPAALLADLPLDLALPNLSVIPVWRLTGVFAFFLFMTGLLWHLRRAFVTAPDAPGLPTWGCGYHEPTARMHYSPQSFSRPFTVLFDLVATVRERLDTPRGLFPRHASRHSEPGDLLEEYLIKPPFALMMRFLALFGWIQRADTRRYILYGIVFLVISLIWIMGRK